MEAGLHRLLVSKVGAELISHSGGRDSAAQVAGEDGLVPTLGIRGFGGGSGDQTEVGGLGLGRAHAERPLCYGSAVEGREW